MLNTILDNAENKTECICTSCGGQWKENELGPVASYMLRLYDWDDEPIGVCPECGDLCFKSASALEKYL